MKLALGSVQFGVDYGVSNTLGKTQLDEIGKILRLAHSKGIATIDTAAAYGDAESALGRQDLTPFNIISKIKPIAPNEKAFDCVLDCFSQTLNDLKQESIYGLLLHNSEDFNHYPEAANALTYLKQTGLVNKVGLSLYSPKQVNQNVLNFADLIQIPANIYDQRFLRTHTLKKLKASNIEIHTRSAFLQGLILMSEGTWPRYFNPMKTQLINLHKVSKRLNITPLSLAINYVCNIKEIDKIVIGVNNAAQLEEILSSLENNIQDVDFDEFNLEDERFVNPANWKLT